MACSSCLRSKDWSLDGQRDPIPPFASEETEAPGKGRKCSATPLSAELELGVALTLSCLLSFKGVFDSLSAEPGWTHSFTIPLPPRSQPQGLCLGEFGREYNLEILVTGLELCSLHLENKVIRRVQFWCPWGLEIYFSAIYACHLFARTKLLTP